jgi:hypothetical protein
MATTFSAITGIPRPSVWGNHRMDFGTINLSGTADTTKCNLNYVFGAMLSNQSVTSGFRYSVACGVISIISGTTGDAYNCLVWGK